MTERKVINYSKFDFTPRENELIRKEVVLISQKYPNHIPIVVRAKETALKMSKNKFLVTGDVTVGQFLHVIRKRLEKQLLHTHALFIMVNNHIPPMSSLLSMVYATEADQDTGMLFFTLSQENTFG